MPGIDPDLLRRVDGLPRTPYQGPGYRHLGPHHPPLSGEGARIRGGRWSPENSFPTLYMGLAREVVVAEFYRLADRQGMRPEALLPRRFQRYDVTLGHLVDLREWSDRESIGLTEAMLSAAEPVQCRAVGDAAHHAGLEGIMVPSATGAGLIVVVFMDKLSSGSSLEPHSSEMWTELPT
jgi:RES domain-containing protein